MTKRRVVPTLHILPLAPAEGAGRVANPTARFVQAAGRLQKHEEREGTLSMELKTRGRSRDLETEFVLRVLAPEMKTTEDICGKGE